MNKFAKLFTVAAVTLTVAMSGVASAAQVDGGNIYYSKNLTKNSAYADPSTADPCDVIQFKIRLHNGGPEVLGNVNVKATMPSGTNTSFSSLATTTSSNGNPSVITDTAGVNVSASSTISYVAGSTELLDANSSVLNTLPDGIIGAGVDVGSVGVSTQQIRFVQFKAKLSCPENPVCPTGTTGVYPKCETPKTPETPATPTSLPNTGAGSILAIFAGVTGLSTLAYSAFARKNS